jgi:hypothetical protein
MSSQPWLIALQAVSDGQLRPLREAGRGVQALLALHASRSHKAPFEFRKKRRISKFNFFPEQNCWAQ